MSEAVLASIVETPTAWLLLAIILAGLEIVVPGVFLIWIAVAAALTGTIALILPIGLAPQFLLFATFCALSVYLGRRWYLARPVASSDPLLNDRAARLIGEEVEVIEPIRHGIGRVKVGDSVWIARGADTGAGHFVRVTGVQGNELAVEPAARRN
jgi:hypothetical protein